jgi:tRNA-splicing ligase RtcB (3'-phosphate/5'-hydroxy nucleic acid ligase)
MKAFVPEGAWVPIKSWCENVEDGAMEQATNLSKLPFVFRAVALMPDCHQGYGMPIGGVIATRGVVVPNAVGVDIGCGMCAVKTNFHMIEASVLDRILNEIRKAIPTGFSHHRDPHKDWMPEFPEIDIPISMSQYESACKQVGTLGGGNHFIEIQKGDDGYIWVMLHSGSRNIGYTVANYYNNLAKKLNEKWFSSVPEEHDLAFLPLDSEEGKLYLREMQYCLDFAKANRYAMINIIMEILGKCNTQFEHEEPINIHHNYATMENHFGKNVMVHRKGATSAREGQLGIIPGSQGTASYIVEGLGNRDSFMSCSHGAGRKMGRKQAQRELSLEEEIEKLNKLGVIHAIRTEKDLDEASGAYKDIDEVMESQKDLVKIKVKLTPMAVVKA